MDIIRTYARKLLDGSPIDQKDKKILPGYRSLERSTPPNWWTDELAQPEWGEILGFHEPKRDTLSGSFVVSTRGLALVHDTITWIPYYDIVGYDTPSKDPIARELVIKTRQGMRFSLSFPEGGVFSFIRFLGTAIAHSERAP